MKIYKNSIPYCYTARESLNLLKTGCKTLRYVGHTMKQTIKGVYSYHFLLVVSVPTTNEIRLFCIQLTLSIIRITSAYSIKRALQHAKIDYEIFSGKDTLRKVSTWIKQGPMYVLLQWLIAHHEGKRSLRCDCSL